MWKAKTSVHFQERLCLFIITKALYMRHRNKKTTSNALSDEKALMDLVQCTFSFCKDFFYILIMDLCMPVCCSVFVSVDA